MHTYIIIRIFSFKTSTEYSSCHESRKKVKDIVFFMVPSNDELPLIFLHHEGRSLIQLTGTLACSERVVGVGLHIAPSWCNLRSGA